MASMRAKICNRLLVAGSVILLAGCASYHFGNATLFPPDISTVYVPMIESHSFRPDMAKL